MGNTIVTWKKIFDPPGKKFLGDKISNFFIFRCGTLRSSTRGVSDMGNTIVTWKKILTPLEKNFGGTKFRIFLFFVVER